MLGTSCSKPWKADFRVLQVKSYVKTCLKSKFSEFRKKCQRKSLIPLEIPVLGVTWPKNRPKWAFLKQNWFFLKTPSERAQNLGWNVLKKHVCKSTGTWFYKRNDFGDLISYFIFFWKKSEKLCFSNDFLN